MNQPTSHSMTFNFNLKNFSINSVCKRCQYYNLPSRIVCNKQSGNRLKNKNSKKKIATLNRAWWSVCRCPFIHVWSGQCQWTKTDTLNAESFVEEWKKKIPEIERNNKQRRFEINNKTFCRTERHLIFQTHNIKHWENAVPYVLRERELFVSVKPSTALW